MIEVKMPVKGDRWIKVGGVSVLASARSFEHGAQPQIVLVDGLPMRLDLGEVACLQAVGTEAEPINLADIVQSRLPGFFNLTSAASKKYE